MDTTVHHLFLLITFSCLSSILAQSNVYIVHMDLSAMPETFSSHDSWYMAMLSSVSEKTYAVLDLLKSSPGYVSSNQDVPLAADTTHTSEFLRSELQLHGIKLWRRCHIGLVGTGIWPERECMNGTDFNSSMCNRKLIGARFFNKGLAANTPSFSTSMNSPRDTDGHGTHISSTAAGNYVEGVSYFGYAKGTAKGMAPKARMAMYKALWETGTFASDVIAAIDQAIADGVDIISLSLGRYSLSLY
uniref:Peptidase S8/S53 domain-containing protein n=1 Tax=Nelumbo nucifera TaxID=4432 RepID=A0A822Y6N7_NELNU|nr:TPA_asm: hypothetical protein HUJ06_029638 [Nelumbo nucifera]